MVEECGGGEWFIDTNATIGPFATKEAAQRWADVQDKVPARKDRRRKHWPTTEESRAEIERLQNVNKQLRRDMRNLESWHNADLKLPRETFTAVVNCLHPDEPMPTDEQRAHAFGLFTAAWKAKWGDAREEMNKKLEEYYARRAA